MVKLEALVLHEGLDLVVGVEVVGRLLLPAPGVGDDVVQVGLADLADLLGGPKSTSAVLPGPRLVLIRGTSGRLALASCQAGSPRPVARRAIRSKGAKQVFPIGRA